MTKKIPASLSTQELIDEVKRFTASPDFHWQKGIALELMKRGMFVQYDIHTGRLWMTKLEEIK